MRLMQNNDPIFQQLDPDYPGSVLVDCLGGDPNFVWTHIHKQTKKTQRYELMDIIGVQSPKLGVHTFSPGLKKVSYK